ncbi:hypothetical protein [Candidatus Binatus sp.]|jgi:hypothetical protein|uniref:hypothetical protein n=1 Tax=Candidatus Binatus sp. TaxID=2811406 RepID=UPI003C84CEBE
MRKSLVLALIAVIALRASAVYAHGVVGDYIFLEPLVTDDATPANEADIVAPDWNRNSGGRTFSIGSSIEKLLGTDSDNLPRFSVGGGSTWIYQSPKQGANVSGFDDLELFAKYAFLIIPQHEFILSAKAVLDLPTGNPSVQSQQHTSLGPELIGAKALGDLPNTTLLKWLRPIGFQFDYGYIPALGGHTSHNMFADGMIEYSLLYLSNNVQDIGLKWPLRNLFLFNEFNYNQLVKGPSGQTFPTILVTPGIAYVSYRFELSVGTQFALNQASVSGNHAAILGLLDIFYDSIFPQGNWKLYGE